MRTMSTAIQNVLFAANLPMLVLVQLEFVSGTVRVCNAGYSFAWNGYTWAGLGALGKISAISESHELAMSGCTLELTGVPTEMIAESLDPADYQSQPATIWLAPLTADYQIIATPIVTFQGRMDTMAVQLGETATIQLAVESKLVDWERPRVRRYNHEDQISEYPDDLGLQYIPQMAEKELKWGRA